MKKRLSLVLIAVLASTGCYHATINTGRQPSGQTVEREWAHSFLYGLVPPSTVETAEQCPNGVARVETQLSFLNQVANFITLGIYSPMTIQVQCAAGDDEDADAPALRPAAGQSARELLTAAVLESHRSGEPVMVDLR